MSNIVDLNSKGSESIDIENVEYSVTIIPADVGFSFRIEGVQISNRARLAVSMDLMAVAKTLVEGVYYDD